MTFTVDIYTAQYDDAMQPRLVPEPGDEAWVQAYPDGREWDAFKRRLRDGGCELGECIDTNEALGLDLFEIIPAH